MSNIICLSLEVSIQLFFFQVLFFRLYLGYFCWFLCIFCIFFESLNYHIYAILTVDNSSSSFFTIDSYRLFMSSFEFKAIRIIINFLVLMSILRRVQSISYKEDCPGVYLSCLNFLDEVWWFLSLRVFGFSSSLLIFPQRFGWYVLLPSLGVCWSREPSRNFELRPLLNPRGSPVLIPLAITGYKC